MRRKGIEVAGTCWEHEGLHQNRRRIREGMGGQNDKNSVHTCLKQFKSKKFKVKKIKCVGMLFFIFIL